MIVSRSRSLIYRIVFECNDYDPYETLLTFLKK